MQKNWFHVTDFLSITVAKYLSIFFILSILGLFILSFMSFTTDNAGKKNNLYSDDTAGSKKFKNLFDESNNFSQKLPIKLNPSVVPFVNDFIRTQSDEYSKMKDWGRPYFNLFNKLLSENNLPDELKYLAVIESDLQVNLESSAGALGPWQLMPDEAKRFHLRIRNGDDERTDFSKSTEVAAQLLKELHTEFGDWLLVIAAYNCGAGCMKRAIEKAGTNNFWELQYYLPAETRKHVKKYIACCYYFEGTGGITTMTADETAKYESELTSKNNQANLSAEEIDNTSVVDVSGKYSAPVIAKSLMMDMKEFDHLNPDFDKIIAKASVYHLSLPKEKMKLFQSKKQEILSGSVQLLLTPTSTPEYNTK